VGIDLKGCQIRGLSHYMPDERYMNAILNGKKEDGTDVHSVIQKLAKLPTYHKGKTYHYLTLFGGGDEKAATDLGMSVIEAKLTRRRFFEGLPALPNLLSRLKEEWILQGYITGIDGRAIWVRAEHMLLVYLLQTLESVVIKNFIIRLTELCRLSPINGNWIVFQLITTMHDEVQFLVKHEHIVGFKGAAEQAIIDVNNKFQLKCPQAIDITTGTTWAECH